MTFAEINGKQVQVESLEGVMVIRLDCEELELTLESDTELRDMVQLISNGGDRSPTLRRDGSVLQLNQQGRYRNAAILRLPVSGAPPISGTHSKGDLVIDRVTTDITLQHGVGNIRVERGSGSLTLDNGKGDIAVRDRSGELTVRIGSGNLNLQRCNYLIVTNIGKGDLQVIECDGEIRTQTGSGNVQLTSCSGSFVARTGSGDIYVNRPHEQLLSINTASGNVLVRDGNVLGMAISVSRGDISSTARLQLPPRGEGFDDEQFGEAFGAAEGDLQGLEQRIARVVEDAIAKAGPNFMPGLDQKVARAVEDAIAKAGPSLRSADFGIVADDHGLRITRGGTPIFEADERGLRFKKGNFAFEAGDSGLRIKRGGSAGHGPVAPGTFDLETHSGNIILDVPYGAPMRVEALVTSGEVRSDVPLVTVGRPGPRGSTQRYVGGTTPGDDLRMNLRLKTDRGDIRVRAVHAVVPPSPPAPPAQPSQPMAPTTHEAATVAVHQSSTPTPATTAEPIVAPAPKPLTEREQRMQAILQALADGTLSIAEAERLLQALDE
ncbi:MAG: hypothetical protein DCC58_09605 [Chloroflexi bacterium]|nr:MAG: hypothetical protein DCC58_09605 [Chloroflexota bacterium]